MRSIDDDTVVITGASSGIGAATARVLGAAGANLVLAARRAERLEALAESVRTDHGVEATVVPTDVTDSTQVDALIQTTVEEHGRLDGLVNNAGVADEGNVETLSDEGFHRMMDVNTDGMFFAARAALPHLRETNGTLVFVASFAGQHPRPGNPVYAATKWWTRGFAHSLEGQVGDDGIAVSVVNPSEVRTEFGSEVGTPSKDRYDPGEVTEPEAVAEGIRFALQQDAVDTASELNLYRRDKFADF